MSLPKKWVVKNRLRRGDTVGLEESRSGPLLVYPKDVSSIEEDRYVSLKAVSQDPRAVIREVTAAYLMGYNMVNVVGEKSQVAKLKHYLRESVHGLLGLEVVAEEPTSLTLQFLLDLDALPPDKLYRRMNTLARSMYLDALEAACNDDHDALEDVMRRDEEINRLFFLMVRLLRSALVDTRVATRAGLTNVQCLDYRLASHHVELLADHSYALAGFLKPMLPLDDVLSSRLKSVSTQLSELHDAATAYFLGSKGADYPSFLTKAGEVESLLSSLKEDPRASRVADRLEDIRRLLVDIADLAGSLYPYVK